MKKLGFFLLLLGLLMMLALPALADQQVYPLPPCEGVFNDEYWSNETYDLLVSGDTAHFLKFRYGCAMDALDEDDQWLIEVSDGQCYALSPDGQFVPCPDRCGEIINRIETNRYSPFFGLTVTPRNETYLIDLTGRVFHWTPGGDAAWEEVLRLDMTGLRPIASYRDWFYCAADEDGLYLFWPSQQEGIDLYAFDWQNGAKRLITHFSGANGVDPAGPGKLLLDGKQKASGSWNYYLIDVASGEVTQLVSGLRGLKVSHFIWDHADGWYYATYDNIQRLGMDAEEASVANFTGKNGYRYMALSTDGQRLLMLADEYAGPNFIVLDLLDASATLTISGNTNLLNPQFGALSSMAGDDPRLSGVQFQLRGEALSANDVAQLLLTRDDTTDVLIVSLASVDLRSLLAKGYFVPLDDQPEIQAYFDQLYPVWREACMAQDSIAALPLYPYDNYQFMVNTELWEEYGLTAPTSYHDLFEVIREMDGMGLLNEYPLFEINGRETRSFDHILYKLLGDALLHGENVSFDDPVLEALLEKLSGLRDLLDRHDDRHLTGSPLMVWSGHATTVTGEQLYTRYGEYAPVMLAIDDDRGPVLQAYLTVLLVNPYSKHIDLAKAWLSHLAANPTAQTRCIFLTGAPDGIETDESLRQRAEYEAREAILQQQYDEAQASGDPDAIEKAQDALYANVEPLPLWTVTPERAKILYTALPYARVIPYSPVCLLLDNGEQAILEYLSGRRSARELLQALQSLAMMMEAE